MEKKPLTPEEKQKKLEQKQREETEGFMRGRPNRAEVANYVNTLLEEKYMPVIQGISDGALIGLLVIQAVLIKKGVTTEEELQELTQQFSKIHKEQAEKENNKSKLSNTTE